MVWEDLLLDGWFELPDLGRALAAAFNVGMGRVLVVDDMGGDFDVSGIAILAERVALPGQFPLKLGISIRDHELWDRLQSCDEKVRIVKRLCRELGASAVLARDEMDGEMDYLIRPTGEILEAEVEEGKIPGEYVLISATRKQDAAA